MAMKWNPLALEKWARAQSPSDWTTLLSLSPPRANLHLSTYLECVATLQRVLEEQKSAVSTKDHGRFWLALSRQLPPHNAKWPDNMHTSMKTTLIERIMHRVSMDPHWSCALASAACHPMCLDRHQRAFVGGFRTNSRYTLLLSIWRKI